MHTLLQAASVGRAVVAVALSNGAIFLASFCCAVHVLPEVRFHVRVVRVAVCRSLRVRPCWGGVARYIFYKYNTKNI